MPVFHLQHPSRKHVTADCGFDHAVAFFVTVLHAGRNVAEYDRLRAAYADLEGALQFLVTHGFFTADQLIEAKLALANDGAPPGDVGVWRAMNAILQFKRAAD